MDVDVGLRRTPTYGYAATSEGAMELAAGVKQAAVALVPSLT
jgi:hypothetical protein